MIGIFNTKHNVKAVAKGFFGSVDKLALAFIPTKGQIFTLQENKYAERKKYGCLCKQNDIIDMELNMNDLELKFIVNGKDYGKAYDLEQGSYRAAVYLYIPQCKIRIL